ncbi:nitroreductase [Streptomyces sp. 35G-GA-8]|uniref:nitroreductase n=1 Tax=Streptomyces sp. 35G-GA-8 TaxID=2939434 RepID=UPI00201F5570|nr:nitroreductase [Streptomyces sp. 35G-GA-8]MCL7377624.1 nitroreductase [Streptomyces sp. 35G-GA-8]
MTRTPVSAADQALRHALAHARSAHVPARAALTPYRSFPWAGESFPLGRPGEPGGPGQYGGPGQMSPGGERVDLDRLLRLSLAVPGGGAGWRRPVPSAGALHPVRLHLLLGAGCSLPPGRYAYAPHAHRVHRRGPAPADAPPGAIAVLTVTAGTTVTHYGHRAWPLLLLDAGHAAAALVLAAEGTAPTVCLDADGATLSAAAGLPRAGDWKTLWPGTEPEQPLAAVRLTPREAGHLDDPLSLWARLPLADVPAARPGADVMPPVALAETRYLLEILGAGERTGASWHTARRPAPVTDSVLPQRRSADPADLTQPPSEELLARILTTAVDAWPDGPTWSAAVGGPTPGLLTLAAPPAMRPGLAVRAASAVRAAPVLRVLATGEARPTLAHWAAGQGWIAEAGAVLLAHGCPSDAPAARVGLDHLAAGYAAGMAHAHAAAEGLPSRPIGSWQQADLGAALGEAPGRDWIVHGLALGGPPAPTTPPREEERP